MTPWLPDAVEHWPLDRLLPYARNARTHSEDQVAQIAASIVEFGWTNPILVDAAGTVVAGHGRLIAARRLGLHTSLADNLMIGAIFTGVSIARSYTLRRLFEALRPGWDQPSIR